jgi:hypothetical protein
VCSGHWLSSIIVPSTSLTPGSSGTCLDQPVPIASKRHAHPHGMELNTKRSSTVWHTVHDSVTSCQCCDTRSAALQQPHPTDLPDHLTNLLSGLMGRKRLIKEALTSYVVYLIEARECEMHHIAGLLTGLTLAEIQVVLAAGASFIFKTALQE